jgi:hypothetical protein
MASALEKKITLSTGQIESTIENPLIGFKEVLRKNMRDVTKEAKKMLPRMIKRRLDSGIAGEGYSRSYAIKKSLMTGRSYSTSGPVDFKHSGQLLRSLEGRGRARPSQDEFRVWVGFRRQQRRSFKRSPNADPTKTTEITNRRLSEILNREKRGTEERPPLSVHRNEEREVMETIAKKLAP